MTRARHLLAALATSLVLLSGCEFAGLQDLPMPGSPDAGPNPIRLTADFEDTLSLARNATVKVDGVTVGRVVAIERKGWLAQVTLEVRDDTGLTGAATARIAQTSLLGEKYVALSAPASGTVGTEAAPLASGSHLPVSSTSRGSEVEDALGALSLVLNNGGIGQLKTIMVEIDRAIGDEQITSNFLEELTAFTTTLDANRDLIVDTLASVNQLARQLAQQQATLTGAIDSFGPALAVLARERDTIRRAFLALGEFGKVTSRVVRRTQADLLANLAALRPVLAELDRAGTKVPQALETVLSFPFPDEVLNAVKGDYVNLDVLVDLSRANVAPGATAGAPAAPRQGASRPGLPGLPGLPNLPGLPQVPNLDMPGLRLPGTVSPLAPTVPGTRGLVAP